MLTKFFNQVLWLSILAWSILAASKTKKISVPEGLRSGEELFNLNSLVFDRAEVKRSFQLQKSSDLVEIHPSGQVTLKTYLDREALCGRQEVCIFDTTIAVMPQQVYEKIILSIEITDVNDNSPVFRSSEVRLEIPEALGVGEEFEVSELIAKDADIEDFATVSYSIVPPGTFDIAVKNGRTFLKVLKKLDRELAPIWSGSVIATDGGGREGSTQLVINIQDSNDNSPRFAQAVHSASIVENAPAGTFVYKVEAQDLDNGLNGEIRYEIENESGKTGKFEIDQKSGVISTTEEIDRETMKTARIRVEARDLGNPSRSGYTVVDVTILDVNDHAPQVSVMPINGVTEDGSILLAENEKPGSFVAFVTVSDLDGDINSSIDVELKPSNYFNIRRESESEFILESRMSFDREIKENYNVEITACDGGKPQRCSSSKRIIKIADKNDNAPILYSESVRFSIPEDAAVGTIVGQILASDKDDQAVFGKLKYQFEEEQKDFGIEEETGEIFVNSELDFELKREYNMTILVTDGGGKSARGAVKVEVQNVNDNVPVAQIPKFIALSSDVQFGDVISTFEIYDADGSEPVIQLGGKDAQMFSLNGNDLIFRSNYSRDLDAEITITVYDGQNTSVAIEYEIMISAAISAAIIGAIAAVAGILILIVVFIFLQRRLRAAHNEKLQTSSNFDRNSAQNVSRADLIIDLKTERSGSEGTICTSARGVIQMNQKSNSRRADSDSGRGESGSETHSRNHLAMLGHYCNQDCLTLGHSDACWLPSNSSSKPFEVDVSDKINQSSSLYVWERTSDYSSHTTSSGNNSSGNRNRSRLPLLPTLHSPTNKPCLV